MCSDVVRKFQIAVIGYNNDACTDKAKLMAYDVGREIAQSGSVLICGGLGGVMEAACKGAKTKPVGKGPIRLFSCSVYPNRLFAAAHQQPTQINRS